MPETQVQIRLFGRFEITLPSSIRVKFETRRSSNLLAQLVAEPGRAFARDELSERLWPEEVGAEARRLNSELWRLRRTLKNAGIDPDRWLAADANGLSFVAGPADVWVDVVAFDDALSGADASAKGSEQELDTLKAAADLYRGDLLPGVFDDWCLLLRELYRARFLDAVERLLNALEARGQWRLAALYARLILAHDQFLEHIHRKLMRYLTFMGDRSAAVSHFRDLKQRLRHELDVEPMQETDALYQALTSDDEPLARPELETVGRLPAELTREIGLALTALQDTTEKLRSLETALAAVTDH